LSNIKACQAEEVSLEINTNGIKPARIKLISTKLKDCSYYLFRISTRSFHYLSCHYHL